MSDCSDRCEIDLAVDYRALLAEPDRFGPTLAVEELAANKVLHSLIGADARDFFDLVELMRHFQLQAPTNRAGERDTGFVTTGSLESLTSLNRFIPDDLGVDEAQYHRLAATVAKWENNLGRVRRREPPDRGMGFDR